MTKRLVALLTTLVALSALALAARANAEDWTYQPENDRVGRIYYYERTNTDGTNDERVTVFRRSATEIEVYKEKVVCYNAALVTATLDFDTFTAPTITGGQLLPDAEHQDFAFLAWNQNEARLDIRVALPDMEIIEEAPVPRTPWHLFDFDLASLTVMTPHLARPEDGFAFGMPLVWTDPEASDPLIWMGDVQATYDGREDHLGADARRYALTGSAFTGPRATGDAGTLWLDAADGHVVDALFPVPNHAGYTDFRLRLLIVSDGGEAEWAALLRAHFEGC